jgi:hypothetical protein
MARRERNSDRRLRPTVLAGIAQAEQPRSSVSKTKRALRDVRTDGRSGARTVGTFSMKPEHRDGR